MPENISYSLKVHYNCPIKDSDDTVIVEINTRDAICCDAEPCDICGTHKHIYIDLPKCPKCGGCHTITIRNDFK